MENAFRSYHPWVNFLYFFWVLLFSMVFTHPAAQVISLLCALGYLAQWGKWEGLKGTGRLCIPLFALTALINPLFSHQGSTVLMILPTGSKLTLESTLYGLSAGCMLVSVVCWFASFHQVITTDKFLYLFGRWIPALSLILSMTLRFVPRFRLQLSAVVEAQRSIGRDVSKGSLWQRTKIAVSILSILVTWALEDGIQTADSMKSRGYGGEKRTSFSLYRLTRRDGAALVFLGVSGAYLLVGLFTGVFDASWFPRMTFPAVTPLTFSFYLVYGAICAMPIFLNALEERKWKATVSKI